MALNFVQIGIYGSTLEEEKSYVLRIDNETVFELINSAKKLNLANLKNISVDTIFNYSQCQEILKKEISKLIAGSLSEKVHDAAEGLEAVLKDISDPFNYLLLKHD